MQKRKYIENEARNGGTAKGEPKLAWVIPSRDRVRPKVKPSLKRVSRLTKNM